MAKCVHTSWSFLLLDIRVLQMGARSEELRLVGLKKNTIFNFLFNTNVYLPAKKKKMEKETRMKGFSVKAGVIFQSRWELTGIICIKKSKEKTSFLSRCATLCFSVAPPSRSNCDDKKCSARDVS